MRLDGQALALRSAEGAAGSAAAGGGRVGVGRAIIDSGVLVVAVDFLVVGLAKDAHDGMEALPLQLSDGVALLCRHLTRRRRGASRKGDGVGPPQHVDDGIANRRSGCNISSGSGSGSSSCCRSSVPCSPGWACSLDAGAGGGAGEELAVGRLSRLRWAAAHGMVGLWLRR